MARDKATAGPSLASRPRFARDFPEDAALDALVRAFVGGDFATVRREAPALAKRTGDTRVREAATVLRARIEPDLLVKWLLALTALLLMGLAAYWLHEQGGEAEAGPGTPGVAR